MPKLRPLLPLVVLLLAGAKHAEQVKIPDEKPRLMVKFSPGSRFGIACAELMDRGKPKLLTHDEAGRTNNTCIVIDGKEYLFGNESPDACFVKDKGILQKNIAVSARECRSVMEFKKGQVRVIQLVELAVGVPTRLYDTALVRYTIENRDKQAHVVGLRFLLDNQIGANNGPPFFIPATETSKSYFVTTMKVFTGKDVPEYVRVIESAAPEATVSELGLQFEDVEPPQKLVLCRWPGDKDAGWEWKYKAINDPPGKPKDSCAVIYWDKKATKPREKRQLAFTYGLGRIGGQLSKIDRSKAANGRLVLLSLDRINGPGKELELHVYVKGGGGNVELQLPAGISLAAGKLKQAVPVSKNKDEYQEVSWKIKSSKVGLFTIKVKHDLGTVMKEIAVQKDLPCCNFGLDVRPLRFDGTRE